MRTSRVVVFMSAAASTAIVTASAWALAPVKNSTFADESIGNAPQTIAESRNIRVGSFGSGMFRTRKDAPHVFYMVTDRGPNGQPSVRTFPTPDFDPMIVKVRVRGESVDVLERIPLKTTDGSKVTGISNKSSGLTSTLSATAPQADEVPWNFDGTTQLSDNKNGLDTEDIVRTSDGNFYLVDEYRPSIVKVGPDGTVLDRFIPKGTNFLTGGSSGYPVHETLPERYAYRRPNRGFEGLAISPDESTIFVALQSPLQLPGTGNTNTGRDSRNTRILRMDLNGNVLGEYVYRFDVASSFDPANAARARDMKVSGLYAISDTKVLVLERTDFIAKVYMIDLAEGATDLLGWTAPLTLPNRTNLNIVEQQNSDAQLAAAELTPLTKTLVVDLSTIDGMPNKVESIAMLNPSVIAVANDNDFGLTDFPTWDATGNLTSDTGVQSKILYVELPSSLPLPR